VITAINYATAPAEVAAAAQVTSSRPSRFMDRLPVRLRHARLIAIEAEDHYLRVHTDAGSDLVLMRLSDALAELDGVSGARTHRSWWVARDAVVDVVNSNGRTTLTLKGEIAAPVSRSSRATLAKEGWFG
jgi:DNA-binding LytR/AlgR family response regulator